MPGIDPLVDYRCNMVYVVIMTEEKKRFHPRILILRMLATNRLPIIWSRIPMCFWWEKARNCTLANTRLLAHTSL
jgi:hypothetical protein